MSITVETVRVLTQQHSTQCGAHCTIKISSSGNELVALRSLRVTNEPDSYTLAHYEAFAPAVVQLESITMFTFNVSTIDLLAAAAMSPHLTQVSLLFRDEATGLAHVQTLIDARGGNPLYHLAVNSTHVVADAVLLAMRERRLHLYKAVLAGANPVQMARVREVGAHNYAAACESDDTDNEVISV